MFNNTYTISEKEWDKVKRIHQRCLDEKAELEENNDFLTKECTKLAIENKDLELENTKLKKELEETKLYLKLFMEKSERLIDLIQGNNVSIKASDLLDI
jgi:regulator of replication initiation timing